MADPRDRELERSPEARQLAERALVALLAELEGTEVEIVILGGLVPEVLVSGQDPPAPEHLGTTDVDILVVSHLTLDEDLGPVQRALETIDFEPGEGGWRWRGRVDRRAVKMEFLCDLDERRDEDLVELNGCSLLHARNLRGTGYVARDWSWEPLRAPLPEGGTTEVKARFARLGGYLLSKVVAARTRAADKDYYDLAYVLLYNRAGGPRQAARAIFEGDLADALPALRSALLEIGERYRVAHTIGPEAYARQAGKAGFDADEVELRLDAVVAVREFISTLEELDKARSAPRTAAEP